MSLFKDADGNYSFKKVLAAGGLLLCFIMVIAAITFRTDAMPNLFDMVKLILSYIYAIVF